MATALTHRFAGRTVVVTGAAFVVRMTLMPALMTLIGRANWWYPRWAGRLTPHLAVEGIPRRATREPDHLDETEAGKCVSSQSSR